MYQTHSSLYSPRSPTPVAAFIFANTRSRDSLVDTPVDGGNMVMSAETDFNRWRETHETNVA